MKRLKNSRYAYWVFWPAWGVVSYLAASLLVSGALLGLLKAGVGLSLETAIANLTVRSILYVVLAGIFVAVPYLLWRIPVTRREAGLSRQMTWMDLGLAVAGTILYGLLSMTALYFVKQVPGFDTDQVQDLGLGNVFGAERLMAFVTLVIIAPLVEEFVFRGVLYGKLRAASMPVALTGLVVSVLFAVAHGQWNVGIDVFCMSVVACALRELTGSIWAGIVMHMIKNGIAFYLLFVAVSGF